MTLCQERRNEKARNHPGVKVNTQGAWTTSYPRGGLLVNGFLAPFFTRPKEEEMGVLEVPTRETERLRLRSLRQSDYEDYAAMKADPEVLRYLVGSGGVPWDRGRSWRHLAFLLGHWQLVGAGMWAIEHKRTGSFLGIVGFGAPEGWPGFELAWTLARRWWGHGYATEGAREALAYAFDDLKRDRIISMIDPENRASIRVAERIGERLLSHSSLLGREMLCYGLDRETYLAQVANPAQELRISAGECRSQF